MIRFLRSLFKPRVIAVRYKNSKRSAYKSKHNQLAKELGTTIRWVE